MHHSVAPSPMLAIKKHLFRCLQKVCAESLAKRTRRSKGILECLHLFYNLTSQPLALSLFSFPLGICAEIASEWSMLHVVVYKFFHMIQLLFF